ncbi:MAG: DUF5663 domain-containing protein [Candidatus Paceibacterota bacterium]|jgi:hypothetical protein|nr:DUF5663 domain-containing protein [bacterium]
MNPKEKISIHCKDIISELNLENLSEDEQVKMISEMSDVVYEKIILRVLDKLSIEDSVALTNLLNLEKHEESTAFLNEKIPNFEKIIDEEVTDFQEELIKFSK